VSSAPWSLDGRAVLLTGVAGALGVHVARALTAAGARIYGVDRNRDNTERMRDEGVLSDVLIGDVTQSSFLDEIAQRWPDVDVLINNVGAATSKTLADTSDDVLSAMLDVNLRPAVGLCRRIMPEMGRRGGGKVINIASVLALHPVPTVAAYAASKAAIVGFTRSIALEYAPRRVQANVLAPGYLEASKNNDYFASEAGHRFVERFTPTNSIGTATALDGPVLFLASSMSDHVTGHVLIVDGGYSIW